MTENANTLTVDALFSLDRKEGVCGFPSLAFKH